MKKYISKIVMFLSMLFPGLVQAGAGWSGEATITGIYALSESSAVIKLSNFSNPHNCNIGSAGDIWINPTTQKTWFTMLLSAYMSGKKVNIYVTAGCDTTHWAGSSFGRIGHVRLVQ